MHVNNRQPNILQDMQASANGVDLRNRDKLGRFTAKRWNVPKQNYPYQSKRQIERVVRRSR